MSAFSSSTISGSEPTSRRTRIAGGIPYGSPRTKPAGAEGIGGTRETVHGTPRGSVADFAPESVSACRPRPPMSYYVASLPLDDGTGGGAMRGDSSVASLPQNDGSGGGLCAGDGWACEGGAGILRLLRFPQNDGVSGAGGSPPGGKEAARGAAQWCARGPAEPIFNPVSVPNPSPIRSTFEPSRLAR